MGCSVRVFKSIGAPILHTGDITETRQMLLLKKYFLPFFMTFCALMQYVSVFSEIQTFFKWLFFLEKVMFGNLLELVYLKDIK